jgi:hypothetical protein
MLFSLPAGTEMFHFPAFPPHTLCIQMRVTRHDSGWVPPFGHPGITAWLTAPPGLSRPPTSFIGSWCQGIHRLPLKTYLHRETKMLASTMHISTNNQPTPTRRTPGHEPQRPNRFDPLDVIGAEVPSNACSFRTQQGAKTIPPAAPQPVPCPRPKPGSPTRVNCSRCRHDLPSVSAI